MTMKNPLNGAPYYDDYDVKKNYVAIAAIPGRIAQAREFTQAQTILRDHISRLGDALLANGSIISGCSLVINGTSVTVTEGSIYLEGLVRDIDSTALTITGIGFERICVKVVQTIVTENEDSSLRDPAQNYENAGQAGAHRIKETVVFSVARDTDVNQGVTIYTLSDGELLKVESQTDTQSYWIETLARRTYDEAGSYKVNGLELRDRGSQAATEDGILLTITDGKAYVKGYEVTKQTSSTIKLDYCTETRNVRNEPKVYREGVTNVWNLTNVPAKELKSVMAVVETSEIMIRGVRGSYIRGGIDTLNNQPVVSIKQIMDATKTYTQGIDYQLSGDSVDWSLSGDEPELGATYSVIYTYNREMEIGEGKEVVLRNELDSLDNKYRSKVEWLSRDVFPVPGSTLLMDYSYYLARKDLIVLDQNGLFTVYKGTPDLPRLVESPINQDEGKLVIGTVMISPGYSSVDCDDNLKTLELNTNDTTRLSQLNLQNLKRRVDDLEYDIALSDLDEEAADGESATLLRGIYTDGFIGVSKCDVSHPDFHCCIDIDNAELTLPFSSGINKIKPNLNSIETVISKIGGVYMAPYRNEVAVIQNFATKKMLINPYSVYNNMALIKLNPSVDNWIDSNNITVEKTATTTTTLRRWWYHRGESWAESERQKWLSITGTSGEQLGWSTFTGQTVTTTTATILDEAIMYMRPLEIEITGSNFTPDTDNLVCYFNDIRRPLSPTGSTRAGAEPGTLKADERGRFTGKFTIPDKSPCGTVGVEISNGTNKGTAVYSAQGRKQVIQTTVLTTKITVNPYDPLAQAFQFDEDTVLTQVGLFFATKDLDKNMVVQVRNMVNGYPGTTIYDEIVVESESIYTSNNGTVETIVKFSQPVYCNANEQYCICLLSDSDEYAMWVATLGEQDVNTKNYVTSQPYVAGVLFSSSNAQTWTAHQDSDLKFKLYKAVYTGEKGVILFDIVETGDANRILIAAQSLDKQNTGVKWFYKVTGKGTSKSTDEEWMPIETYVDRELDETIVSLNLKVEISPTASISPMLAGDVVNLISFIEEGRGTYVSRTVMLDNPYNTIAVSYEACIPNNTSVSVSVSYDNSAIGTTWVELTESNSTRSIVAVDENFVRYQYIHRVAVPEGKTGQTIYAVRIDMTSSNPVVRPRVRKLMSIMRNE